MTYVLKPTDKKCYPLYAKCNDLDVPVCFQTGQSAEPLPSEPGYSMYADEIPMDFPDLTIVFTHGAPGPKSSVQCYGAIRTSMGTSVRTTRHCYLIDRSSSSIGAPETRSCRRLTGSGSNGVRGDSCN
jgi:hypothetical protein